jgi:hypothetical protein
MLDYAYNNACILAFNNSHKLSVVTVLDGVDAWTEGACALRLRDNPALIR